MKWKSNLHKLIDIIYEITNWLKLDLSDEYIEELAIFVYTNMSEKNRYYHNMEHIFNLIIKKDHINNISAIYHDIVYYQIENNFNIHLEKYVKNYIFIENNEFIIKISDHIDNKVKELLFIIFWIKQWDKLNIFNWLNEFLSACIMYEQLWKKLDIKNLIEIFFIIEATIPFRKNYINITLNKLNKINEIIKIDKEKIIINAIKLSNQDVLSFCEKDLGFFLESTWKLLPENNLNLRDPLFYNIWDYKNSLFKTYNFFNFLDYKNIFHQYNNIYPSENKFKIITKSAKRNIENWIIYIKFKLISISIIESIAKLSWWDNCITLFMWDLNHNSLRLEDYFKNRDKLTSNNLNKEINKILKNWLWNNKYDFDFNKSPILELLYKNLWYDNTNILWDFSVKYIKWEISEIDFLKKIDKNIIKDILFAMSKMAVTRKEKIKNILKLL